MRIGFFSLLVLAVISTNMGNRVLLNFFILLFILFFGIMNSMRH